MRKAYGIFCVLCLLAATACGSNESGIRPGGDGSGTGDGTGDGLGGGNGGSGSGGNTGSQTRPLACEAVDVVFSLDASTSMTEERDAMRNDVFPGFARQLIRIGAGLRNFRVGVMDACPAPSSFHTAGASACNFEGGNSWMESRSSKLEQEFACVADVHLQANQCSGDNDDEQPANSIASSLVPGTNSGFLRDEALLVMVAITDEDEQPTPSLSVDEAYNKLLANKGGDVTKMVFLGIGGTSGCDGAYGKVQREAQFLRQLTAKFESAGQGLFWDLCEGKLEDGFAQAMTIIESACNDLCDLPEDCGRQPCNGEDDECPGSEQCKNGYCERKPCDNAEEDCDPGEQCVDPGYCEKMEVFE